MSEEEDARQLQQELDEAARRFQETLGSDTSEEE